MLKREDVFAYTEACYNGEPASCSFACPFRVDLRSVMKKAAKGKLSAAAKELRQALPFPNIIAALCDHPCESCCQRQTVMGEMPVQIGLIEKACLSAPVKKERSAFKAPLLDTKIAVVGAGVAGLCCALYLDKKRYSVTVFERENERGGSLRQHPDNLAFEKEFSEILDSTDIQFRFGEEIIALDALKAFDAICLCTGADGETFGLVNGYDRTLYTTNIPKVFLCGECAGMGKLEGMAAAVSVARSIEAWLQSGDASYAKEDWNKANCRRYAPIGTVVSSQPVTASDNGFTSEQAQREAERCMQCDCEACMEACELLKKYKKKPPRIAQDVAQDGQTRNSVSSAAITRETWSCSLCGRCGSICREGVDLSGLFELSRCDRVKSKEYPPAIHDYRMREFKLASGTAALTIPDGKNETCEMAFFPGCRLGAYNPEYVTETFEMLRNNYGRVGLLLNCCGIPALWAGEKEEFNEHISFLRESWKKLGSPLLVYACASCRRTLERFLPEIPLKPVYGLLPPSTQKTTNEKMAIFDPCAAAGAEDLKQAVRRLAIQSGIEFTDYSSDGKCCGFGGHIRLANLGLFDEITKNRCAETEEPFLTYCVNCTEIFQKGGKACRHVLDLSLGKETYTVPPLEKKRENMLSVRRILEEKYLGRECIIEKEPWESISLTIEPSALEKMERRLVPEIDVKETIWRSEKAKDGFENEAGDVLCRLPGKILTCWVKYRRESDSFRVLDVYVHRMHIREEEDG